MTETTVPPSTCLYCDRTSDDVPLIQFHYQGAERWICAQHLPILIHQPQKLTHNLPDADCLGPPGERHH
jgi:hypothetical protein